MKFGGKREDENMRDGRTLFGTDRRSLLKLAFGAVLAQTVKPLSVFAGSVSSDTKDFSSYLTEKYLKVSRLTLKVGADKPFSALHFSDTHVSLSDARDIMEGNARSLVLFEARQPRFPVSVQSLAATLSYGMQRGMPLLNTGDLFDYRSEANIGCIANSFAGKDVFSALGNHEGFGHHTKDMNPETAEAALALRKRYESAMGHPLLVASKVVNGVNFVAYDNGGLERWHLRERLEAIRKEFAKGLPVVLMCHKPLDTPEMRTFVTKRIVEKARKAGKEPKVIKGFGPSLQTDRDAAFMDELRSHKDQIKAILCGHLHTDIRTSWNGVPMIVAGGNFEGKVNEIEFV